MTSNHRAKLFGLAALLLTTVSATAQYGRDIAPRDMVNPSPRSGGYCDNRGCPNNFWRYRIYYGPIYYNHRWFRGPVYVKDDYGRNWFWVDGGWHRDQWPGSRPSWARNARIGPALPRDFYLAHFGDPGRQSADSRNSQGYRDNQYAPGYGDGRPYGGDYGAPRNDAFTQDRRDFNAPADNGPTRGDAYGQQGYGQQAYGQQGFGQQGNGARGGYNPQDSAPQDNRQTRDQYQSGGPSQQYQRPQNGYAQNGQGGGNNASPPGNAGSSGNGGSGRFDGQAPNNQGGQGQQSNTQAQNQQATIAVTSATYGGSCKAPKGNVTQALQTACNGKASCQYMVSVTVLGDPARGCQSDFVVEWTCGSGPGNSASLPAEANGNKVNMVCPTGGR